MSLLQRVEKMCGAAQAALLVPKLEIKRKLRVKYGIDPTISQMHLGHTVPLRLLKAFQNEGHLPIIILGDYTATIGDPTGRNETRSTTLTPKEAKQNGLKFLDQIGKIINLERADVHFNSTWFNKCDMRWMLEQLQKFTVSQVLVRDDFQNRLQAGTPIGMHELMYPFLQGYDSVQVEADVEIGATEQLYNLNVGRDMQKQAGQNPQVCLTVPILRGLDGVKKMGKSLGNFIAVTETPFEMFSKVMSIPDELMDEWFTLLTDKDPVGPWGHPKAKKTLLAATITTSFWGNEQSSAASTEWNHQFSERKEPTVVPVVNVVAAVTNLLGVVHAAGLAASKNEARRLVIQGAVDFNGVRMVDPFLIVGAGRLRVGRKYADIERSE